MSDLLDIWSAPHKLKTPRLWKNIKIAFVYFNTFIKQETLILLVLLNEFRHLK